MYANKSIEYFDVLDENGNKTGEIKTKENIIADREFYRIVNLWIINPNTKQILIQRKSSNKDVILQNDEVSDIKYFSLEELINAHNTKDTNFVNHSFFLDVVRKIKDVYNI